MKKIKGFLISFLIAALLPCTAVRAAEQESVILTAEKGMAKIEVGIPDHSEGISTFRLRVKVEGDIDRLDQENPFTFKPDQEITSKLVETRFDPKQGYFTVYISDTSKITDKADFNLGTLTPNSSDDTEFDLRITVPENGLDYVDGTGKLHDEVSIVSASVAMKVNEAEETPEIKPEETPETEPEETPDKQPDSTTDDSETESSGEQQNTSSGDSSEDHRNDRVETEQNDSVQTGDESNLLIYLILAGISVSGIGSVLILRRK